MINTGSILPLRDLGELITSTKASVADFIKPAEFGIGASFAEALEAAFTDYTFEFYERTVRVKTPGKQNIYVSGQSFALAVCLMDFCEEIGRYRAIAYQILNQSREQLSHHVRGEGRLDDQVFTALRDKTSNELSATFEAVAREYFTSSGLSDDIVASNIELLMRFLTDYGWWLGGKQISRGNDWCISPISTLLNMPQNDSNFIARVVSKTTEDEDLRIAFKHAIEHEWEQSKGTGGTTPFTNNELPFKDWITQITKANGDPYSDNTINQYVSALKAASTAFIDAIGPFTSIFEITDVGIFDRAISHIKADNAYEEFNRIRGNGSLSAGLDLYRRYLVDHTDISMLPIRHKTGYSCVFSRNRILFGAPGTGKSFTLNQEKNALLVDGGEYERVTFHPDYSYANFVGTYKPVPCKDSDDKDAITYSYVPGPFMRIYVKALQNSKTYAPKPFLLMIEEINRANVAAVFGDVFQLLDRDDDEVSEYPIQASEDIKKYLAGELGGDPDDYTEIRIPDNMFIWATMNSADQGVFPMDTAFKRRWDFTYLGIDDSEAGIVGKKVILGQGEYRRVVEWNALRKAINNELLTYKVNEDKLMGPYFISKKNLPEGEMIDPSIFTRIFKNKVIMYLFDDAAKQKRITLFGGCDEKAKNQYSKICREFDTKGVYIFCEGISSQFIDNAPEDDEE